MAGYHAGLFSYMGEFIDGLRDPETSRIWGCEKPSQQLKAGQWVETPILEVKIFGTTWRIFRHPALLVTTPMVVAVKEVTRRMGNEYEANPSIFDELARDGEIREAYLTALEICKKLQAGGQT